MKGYVYYKYIHSISQFNVLPVTSRCNSNCLFCSHNQNPPEVEPIRIKDITPEETDELLDFLSPDKKIVIGESATKIIEGEPFCNKNIIEILLKVRKKYPLTPVHITTSGNLLNEKTIESLAEITNLELQISVNAISEKERHHIMGKRAGNILLPLRLLNTYNIPFSSSIVLLPSVTGWKELEETVETLDAMGSEVIKLYQPSFTRYTPKERSYLIVEYDEIKEFCKKMQSSTISPIILEPSLLNDLIPVTEGAIKNSHAFKSGIKKGDEIIKINGKSPFSRVDAYNKLIRLKNPKVKIKRGKNFINTEIVKNKNETSGLTFLYDMNYDTIKDIKKNITDERTLILTSYLAKDILLTGLEKEGIKNKITPVKNESFGGNIACGGLMTVEDIIRTLKNEKYLSSVLIPSIAFDEKGVDIMGRSYLEIEETADCSVTVC